MPPSRLPDSTCPPSGVRPLACGSPSLRADSIGQTREKDLETDTYHVPHWDELSWEGFLEEGPRKASTEGPAGVSG